MLYLYILLIILFFFSLLLNYISFYSKKTAIETVNDMGLGYNMGKVFNYFNDSENETTQYNLIISSRKIITRIKKYGFKTIRYEFNYDYLPKDNISNINSDWIDKIKEVINWIINSNMYCILSILFDGKFWQSKYSKDKYINFWFQIANEFTDFDEYLIFESKNEVDYEFIYDYNYKEDENKFDTYDSYYQNLFNSTQDFIYIIRNSGNFNSKRLLVIPEYSTDVEISYFSFFFELDIPIDPSNKLAVSINYYFPSEIYQFDDTISMDWYHKNGFNYMTNPIKNWGSNNDYKQLLTNFDFLKQNYIEAGIPIINSQVGIVTEKDFDINSMKEFLYVIFSVSAEYRGIMSCLWDISEKVEGDIYYYNKKQNIWRDEKMRDFFINISKGKNVKLSKFYYKTNNETETYTFYNGLSIEFGTKKPLKIIIKAQILCLLNIDCFIGIVTLDKLGNWYDFVVEGNGKKQYDGTRIFTIDVSQKDCHTSIEIFEIHGYDDITFKYMTVEFEEFFLYFDYKSFKSEILNKI